METELSKLREKIDALDYKLLDLFSQDGPQQVNPLNRREITTLLAERIDLVKEVAEYKHNNGLPAFDLTREEAIVASRHTYGLEKGLSHEFVTDLFVYILNQSHQVYASLGGEKRI